jgi:hypothetical protein
MLERAPVAARARHASSVAHVQPVVARGRRIEFIPHDKSIDIPVTIEVRDDDVRQISLGLRPSPCCTRLPMAGERRSASGGTCKADVPSLE